MLFHSHKIFVHLQNINKDISDKIQELSDPDSNITTMFKAQKHKDIIKIAHVTSMIQP